MRKRYLALLGSTGSVGRATLDVVKHLKGQFAISLLAAHSSSRIIAKQACEFAPSLVFMTDRHAAEDAQRLVPRGTRVTCETSALLEAISSPRVDVVVMAMSGTAGLLPVIAALEHGKHVCLASKEILVGFGELIMETCRRHNGRLLPIDSELAGLHQCLDGRSRDSVRKVIITASGGPFYPSPLPAQATPQQVLAHPTWRMGKKITVDSATLMNKGLEVIETVRLFQLKPEQVQAVIHPQSIVHALVEFTDGAILAQMSNPDMRLPVQYCLTYPERTCSLVKPLHLERIERLDFAPLRSANFPCYKLALRALRQGTAATCVLNAANQVAVEAFLNGRIAFGTIPRIVSLTLRQQPKRQRHLSLSALLRLEEWTMNRAKQLVMLHGRNN